MSEHKHESRDITLHHVGDPRVDRLIVCCYEAPNREYAVIDREKDETVELLDFQEGPVCEAGVNGVTNEALLAIVADRLMVFQRGPMACRENALALKKIEEALQWLHARTRRRLAAGVEGRGKP